MTQNITIMAVLADLFLFWWQTKLESVMISLTLLQIFFIQSNLVGLKVRQIRSLCSVHSSCRRSDARWRNFWFSLTLGKLTTISKQRNDLQGNMDCMITAWSFLNHEKCWIAWFRWHFRGIQSTIRTHFGQFGTCTNQNIWLCLVE